MNTLEKYEDIKVSMLQEKTRDTLEKLQKATKNFTIENDKAIAYVNAVHSKLSKEKPEYLRSTTAKPEPKPEPKKAEPKKPAVKKAVAKKSEPKKQVLPKPTPKPKITKTQIKTASAKINTLQLAIQSDPLLQGIGKTDKERDASRFAQPKGRRVSKVGWKNQYGASKGGRTYYESRENRSDRKSPEYKSGYPYLEMGGYTHRLDGAMMADGKYYVIDAKDGKILSKGFDTEEEAKVEKYKIFENTGIFSLTQKKMADGGMMADGGEMDEREYLVKFENQDSGDIEEISVMAASEKDAIQSAYDESGLSDNYEFVSVKRYADGGFMAKGGEMGKIDEIEGDEINMAFNDFDDYAYGGMTKFDWEKAEIGDSALVIAENKMGVIVKTYGRRFHLRFPDGSDKTYSAEELKFFLDEEYAKGGSMKRGSELSQGDINKKVIENIEQYLNYSNNRNERLYVIREIFKEALVDANFGEYQNKIDEIFLGAKKFVFIKNAEETEQLLFQVGQQVANVCGWDRFKISDAIKYTLSMNGFATLANKIDNMYDSTPQKLIYTSKANIKYFLIKNENKSKAFNSIYEIYEPKDVLSGVYKLAKGGELKDAKYYAKDKVIIIGLDGKIITKVNGAWVKKTAKPIGEIEKSDALDAAQDNSWNKYSDKTTKTKKAIIVTSIKDIPNFDKRLDEGKITYRGLGMGKLSSDFFKETGTSGVRIKVDGKEYFITDEEFATFSRGSDGKLRIRFAAPYKKSYEQGGEVKSSEKLPYKLDKYFTKGTKTIEVPLTQLSPIRARETGIENAEKFMRMAFNGDMERRKPISIYLISKGKYKIADGNSTFAVAKKNGWKTIYADVVKNPKMQSNGKKSVFSIAKEIRKDGESWQSAIQRAKSMK